MDPRIDEARAPRAWWPLLLLLLCGCPAPAAPAALPGDGPCCERQPVYDLFAAPYRYGER